MRKNSLFLAIVFTFLELIKSFQFQEDFHNNKEVTKQNNYIQDFEDEDLMLINFKDHNVVGSDLIIEENENENNFFNNVEGSGQSTDIQKIAKTSDTTKNIDAVNTENCTEPGYTQICSNSGGCSSNKCFCNSFKLKLGSASVVYSHSGKYCEECSYCKGQRCQNFLPCIECNLIHNDKSCDSLCPFQNQRVVKVITVEDRDEKICDVETTNNCFVKFKYYYNTKNEAVVEYEDFNFCFDGYKFVIITFWGVVFYILSISFLVPKFCGPPKPTEIKESRTSLSSRCDVLRQPLPP